MEFPGYPPLLRIGELSRCLGVSDHVLRARPAAAGRVFEAGGPEVPQYVTMLRRVAAIQGRPLPILSVPLLTPGCPPCG